MIIARWEFQFKLLHVAVCLLHHSIVSGYYFSANDITGTQLRRNSQRSHLIDRSSKKPASFITPDELQTNNNWKALADDIKRSTSANEESELERKITSDDQIDTNQRYRTVLAKEQPDLPSFAADAQPTELQEFIPEIKPDRDRRAALPLPLFISRLNSIENSQYSMDRPPKNWTPNYCIPETMTNLRGTSKSSSFFSHMCSEGSGVFDYDGTIFPSWIKNARVLGICPWKLQDVPLSEGTIPSTLYELKCLCENKKCSSGGTAQCVAVIQHVTVWRRKSSNRCEFIPDLVPVTVNCLCVQQPAPIAGSIGSPALFQ